MELRQLRHFLQVAQELHFGRAAIALGMAQPPLSQSIQRLEESLGTPLFDRTSRQVALTAAGKVLVREARLILAQVEFAEKAVMRQAAGELSRLRIGFAPMSVMRTLPEAIRQFRRRWPDIDIQLDEQLSTVQVEELRKGRLDLGIINRNLVNTEGLEVRAIEYSRLIAAVPSKWELGKRESIKLADLAGHSLVVSPQHLTPDFHQGLEVACRKAGFSPKRLQQVSQSYSMLNLVANEMGIGLVQDSARHLSVEGVSFVAIEDLPDFLHGEAAIAWVPRAVSPTVQYMIGVIEKVANSSTAL